MANTNQTPNLEGLHRESGSRHAKQMRMMNKNNTRLIQLLAKAHLPPSVALPVPDAERSHHSRHSKDHSQNHSTGRESRERRRSRSPVPPRREMSLSPSESRSSSKTARAEGREIRRGRSPRRNDQAKNGVEDVV
ncbi:hypothetical protein Acr_00g0037400 [Actinidia rufa]|uniref:Uncharacterized protein n=1 Tax=Actinidia rufa TaxID=165716 RepID=A0A7J0DH11_9ERIC|nr:hypothetical protein Acr_00g0037400 [Actinidia rufa]